MKLFIGALSLCLVAIVAAQSADPAVQDPSVEYLPPVGDAEAAALSEDGYRYKTVRRLKLRHRREVPNQEYLPPTGEYLPPIDEVEPAVDTKVADDGYRYKTVRKLKFRARHRRDVSEIAEPTGEYLPPVEVELAPELKTVLGADGYRYKTVRKLKFRRHRREAEAEDAAAAAAEATNGEYLPPVEVPTPAPEAEVKSVADEGTEVAKDGYRYKTVRRIRYRYRH